MQRLKLATLIATTVPLGFLSKFYTGPAEFWINNSLGGILYVIFWCLVAQFVNPRWKAAYIVVTVFAITAGLETLQLWHPPLLEWIRSHFLGATLIGTQFVWTDFAYYAAGALVGYCVLRPVCETRNPKPETRNPKPETFVVP